MKPNAPFSPFGNDLFGDPIQQIQLPVARQFIVPPFSVLSARDGDWQERKRAWISIGIQSEIGRKSELTMSGSAAKFDFYRVKEGIREHTDEAGTSTFDPVLCEVIYSWFTRNEWTIVDPFAGGSVRGIVASCLGRKYWGGELRQEQVDANQEQAREICKTNPPQYVCGDSAQTLDSAPDCDFIFSCPPYGNLETYSALPGDLSNMEWHTFLPAYKRIIFRTTKKLRNNRFACFVVGDFRDERGFYRDFVSETIRGFKESGLELYNEAILVTSVGSASMRVTNQFMAGRKFCKTHQNVLIFCKGDWRKAVLAIRS